MAEVRVRANLASKEHLEEKVRQLGGKMTTWEDAHDRLLRATQTVAGQHPSPSTELSHNPASRLPEGGAGGDG